MPHVSTYRSGAGSRSWSACWSWSGSSSPFREAAAAAGGSHTPACDGRLSS